MSLEQHSTDDRGRADVESTVSRDATLAADVDVRGLADDVPERSRAVLLTGATGYLGGFLLADLLSGTDAQVHCLVRADSPGEARTRLRGVLARRGIGGHRAERVRVVHGSLTKRRLGLTDDAHRELARGIDAIYHCGAWVNLIAGYPTLRGGNVGGTLEVLRLATRLRKKTVHHVSTVGVLIQAYEDGAGPLPEDRPLPPPGGVGYFQSKWVAERLVHQAAERGVPVTVHRPGVVLADSATGLGSASDWFMRLTAVSVRAGCSPAYDFPLSVAPADFTSRSIVELSRRPRADERVFHNFLPRPMSLDEYFRVVDSCGYRVPSVPHAQWLAAVKGLRGVDRATVRIAESLPQILLRPRNGNPTYPTSDATAAALGSSVTPPSLDRAYFTRMLADLARQGNCSRSSGPLPGDAARPGDHR
ncbi:thioester reductase domain-containing protein [Actinosynnema sp. NPDC053489]|uniref:thioester reductase domain-containing protein n=1 Tax=Actinosynnema sp. NPDC053489 TaxID=3363916 RepID=UPI0037C883F5